MPFWPLPSWVPALLLLHRAAEWMVVQHHLRALDELPGPDAPVSEARVCLCIPARNEAAEVGRALDSWLAQDFPGLRIVVVDDGSTDGTAELLAGRQQAHPERLTVLRNEVLPPGWLGKNHALHLATRHPWAQEADWLLFSDADVRAEASLLRRAVAHAHATNTEALALLPGVEAESWWERLLIPIGMATFLATVPPVRVADPGSAFSCGVGGFTLLRREAYEAVGGHAAAPLEPIDDMRLAQRAKRAGFRNRVGRGGPGLRLRMYPGGWAFVRAMRKNVLGLPGLWPFAPLLAVLVLILFLGPLLLAWGGWPELGLLLWLAYPPLVGDVHQRVTGTPLSLTLAFWPLAGFPLALGILWAFVDRLRGVNHWRGREVRVQTAMGASTRVSQDS